MKKNEYNQLIKGLTDRELLFHLFLTQIILLTIAFVLGIILFENLFDLVSLFEWTDPYVWQIGVLVGIAIVIIDVVLMRFLPKSLYDDGGLNERIFRNKNIIHIAIISAVVAFSEEILFRGVIQTHFGIVISSIIFALVHYRYLFNWFLFLNIIFVSFIIGYIFLVTENLAVTVAMHFTIDFLLGVFIRYRTLGRQVDV
ncbi:type II CAAX endopeptidase family protein [Bacillus sp. B15-48]|uniref:CPBP family intramembrane glutamic endopeptidase n=1 Tax=Bacillus sp. B15-48 TaxID=1548601 RepID=UPI00193F2F7D|nr:type II CAAX endopeptidase family protein [Bacillus sp. B15-48]MBM4762155.1 CPBP family intramembrane metalloprotease [Bacillus sp. B15-48]